MKALPNPALFPNVSFRFLRCGNNTGTSTHFSGYGGAFDRSMQHHLR